MTNLAQRAITIAHAEEKYVEQGGRDGHSGNLTKYGEWYGLNGQPWCAIFQTWVWARAGVDLRKLLTPAMASCERIHQAAIAKGIWHRTPLPGDLVLFHFSEDSSGPDHANHVELVTAVHGQYDVDTIGGNTSNTTRGSQRNGGGVYPRRRRAGILGYARVTELVKPAAPTKPKPRPQPPAQQVPAPREDPDMAKAITADGVAIYAATATAGAIHIPDPTTLGAMREAGLLEPGVVTVSKDHLQALIAYAKQDPR